MEKTFDNEFTEIISNMVSLGYEFVNGNAEYIYIYGCMEENVRSFNAFYRIAGEIKTLNLITTDAKYAFSFLRLGTEDVLKLRNLFKAYSQKCPTEIKLTYNVQTGEFDIEYQYDPVWTDERIDADVFNAWVEEEKRKLR